MCKALLEHKFRDKKLRNLTTFTFLRNKAFSVSGSWADAFSGVLLGCDDLFLVSHDF